MHVGMRMELSQIAVGYAYVPGEDLGESHRMSIGYRWK